MSRFASYWRRMMLEFPRPSDSAHEHQDANEGRPPRSRVMDELRSEYARDLPARLSEIQAAVGQARASRTKSDTQTASDLAHRMQGTSGTLLFDGLSQVALQLEMYLEEVIKQDKLVPDETWRQVEQLLGQVGAASQEILQQEDALPTES